MRQVIVNQSFTFPLPGLIQQAASWDFFSYYFSCDLRQSYLYKYQYRNSHQNIFLRLLRERERGGEIQIETERERERERERDHTKKVSSTGKVFKRFADLLIYSKSPLSRQPLSLPKSGLKDHLWIVQNVVFN